ncbi:cytochrome c oxidase assembly protein [Epidermidibacterium keratini]|uniref:Cytochrome c oxidase assembly protein n=1 Tax=Epidermidibacterium keratini TaxID=1891644 RepID=A0A7L4YS68_9ACTN|nr:cytochrome c oxidase assembly protein [Epidermidibacterium keratini]QHC01639.1 cytochrome c oxidase assembly protein [Epidermidibacterium keratini]
MATTLSLGEVGYDRRGFAGLTTGVITSVLRSLADFTGWLVVGSLICGLFVIGLTKSRDLPLRGSFELRLLRITSGWWAVLSLLMVGAEAADANGVPLSEALSPEVMLSLVPETDYARAWLLCFACATIVFILSTVASLWRHLLVPLVLSMIGVLAPVVVGSILVGPDHDFGSDGGTILAVISAAALGSVVTLTLRLACGRDLDMVAARRLATLGTIAMPVALASEVLVVWFKLAGSPITGGLAGQISMVRLACLAVLTALAFWLRHVVRRAEGVTASMRIAVLVAGLVAAVSLGGQIAMTRFLSPQYYVPTSITEIFLGFNVPEAPTAGELFGHWRINVLFAVLAAAGLISYGAALWRLRRRGDAWPVGRTVSWVLGWAIIVFATSSGFGRYSAPDFGVHMIVHMSLNMVGPLFLVMGGAITLFLRASTPSRTAGPHEMITSALNSPALGRLYHPLLVFALFVGSYYALYLTPLFGNLIRYHWAHQAMNIHFLVVGYLFFGLAIGVDRTPRQLPHVGKLGFVFAAMPFHAFFGVALMSTSAIIAEEFYNYLDLPWMDLTASQRMGGGVAWAGSEIPLLIVVIALVAQWSRLDNREAKRKDRHYDSGLDTEYDAYNEMLRSLSDRDGGAGAARGASPARGPVPSATGSSPTDTTTGKSEQP